MSLGPSTCSSKPLSFFDIFFGFQDIDIVRFSFFSVYPYFMNSFASLSQSIDPMNSKSLELL